MKRTILIISLVVLLIPLLWIGYTMLPIEITRKTDIEFGNELIVNIENYKDKYSQLPLTDDWQTLERLGFKIEMLGTDPTYQKISNNEYELIYLKGFDGPYLLYNSKINKWKVDFPKYPQKEQVEMEQNFPWSKQITKTAIQAIINSIENKNKNPNYNGNFPTNIYDTPFLTDTLKDFEIIGFSKSVSNPDIFKIDFHPKNKYKTGPRYIVELNIKTGKAIKVYMAPDA